MTKRIFISVFILILPCLSYASSLPLFTQKYERSAGKPNTYTASIDNCNTGADYSIVVQNGEGGINRLSSSSITLNGVEVVRENEFNQRVERVEKAITLQPENTLNVRLASGPGGFITVNIYCSANCLDIEITNPVDAATINTPGTIVRGLLHNVYGETGVTIDNGGVRAISQVQGENFAGMVSLRVGANTITAIATDACGYQAKDTIIVNTDSIEEPVRLSAMPSSGVLSTIGSLEVTFEAEANIPNPVANYSWDFNGDGIVDESGSAISEVTANYEQTGLYLPSVTVTDTLGSAYTETTVVNVLSRDEMDNLFKNKWEGMRGKLMGGDVEGAVRFFYERTRNRYREQFTALAPVLNEIASDMGEMRMVNATADRAEYEILIDRNGKRYSFHLIFVRDEDGIWRIENF